MTMKKLLLGAVLSMVYAGAVIAAPALKVATEPTFPPFEFIDVKTKKFVGYEMDLIQEVGKKIGMEIVMQPMGFDAIIPAIMGGTVDVGVAGMTITAERQKRVDFTTPDFVGGLAALVRAKDAGRIKDHKDIMGKQVCAQLGTTGMLKAQELSGKKPKTFNNVAEAMIELGNGGCEAVIADKPVAEYFMKESRQEKNFRVLPVQVTTENWGFAVQKGNKALLDKLNKALADLKADGTIAKIHKKWFGN